MFEGGEHGYGSALWGWEGRFDLQHWKELLLSPLLSPFLPLSGSWIAGAPKAVGGMSREGIKEVQGALGTFWGVTGLLFKRRAGVGHWPWGQGGDAEVLRHGQRTASWAAGEGSPCHFPLCISTLLTH